ncbi:MAG: aminotransferase class V-fold PLP-dependent enzyme [Verrucomicrobia bacterium]|nr:aminotransferase class V-fold PLP-dependent enzyme [Verrucomicrobiota bacterium]
MIYLDNHTVTRPSNAAIAAMQPFYQDKWGSCTTPHRFGQRLLSDLEEALAKVRLLLGGRSSDLLLFCPSGAHGVYEVVQAAYLDLAKERGRTHFLTSALDEAPVILSYERLEMLGCETTLIEVDERGMVTADALAEAMTPRTALVSLAWANALTGVIQPVAELAEVCRERGVWFHLEASHVLGKLPIDLDEIAPDFVSFDGSLIHAPQGTGALWVRSGLMPSRLVLGEGATPLAHLAALGVACEEAHDLLSSVAMETARLRKTLEEGLVGELLFAKAERIPTTFAMSFKGVTADALLYRLSRQGLYASFGGGMYQNLTTQLQTCGMKGPQVHSSASFSLSRETSQEEVERAINLINEQVASLRLLSEGLL